MMRRRRCSVGDVENCGTIGVVRNANRMGLACALFAQTQIVNRLHRINSAGYV